MSLPQHVLDHLVRNGTISPTGSSRRAKLRHCPTCGLATLVGDDDDRMALEIHADPTPLNAIGEACALLTGRRTVSLAADGGRLVMWHRYDEQITGQPAGTHPREDVLATHVCGQPIPRQWATGSRHIPATLTALPAGSPAPF